MTTKLSVWSRMRGLTSDSDSGSHLLGGGPCSDHRKSFFFVGVLRCLTLRLIRSKVIFRNIFG